MVRYGSAAGLCHRSGKTHQAVTLLVERGCGGSRVALHDAVVVAKSFTLVLSQLLDIELRAIVVLTPASAPSAEMAQTPQLHTYGRHLQGPQKRRGGQTSPPLSCEPDRSRRGRRIRAKLRHPMAKMNEEPAKSHGKCALPLWHIEARSRVKTRTARMSTARMRSHSKSTTARRYVSSIIWPEASTPATNCAITPSSSLSLATASSSARKQVRTSLG